MTERDSERSEGGRNGGEHEARLARARLAFDRGLRDASEQGVRAARRLVVPALWGAALVCGSLLALAMVRALRRPPAAHALLRVTIEPRLEARPLLPALGAAVARLALQRLLAPSPASSGELAADTTTHPGARGTDTDAAGPDQRASSSLTPAPSPH